MTYTVVVPEPEVEQLTAPATAESRAARARTCRSRRMRFRVAIRTSPVWRPPSRDRVSSRSPVRAVSARRVSRSSSYGVRRQRRWFVDLSRVTDPDAVAAAFLDTLGVSRADGRRRPRPPRRVVGATAVLLVVDNCEHVLDAAGEVITRLLQATHAVRVLATSRQALGVTGEQVVVVAPLTLPSETDSEDQQSAADAVRMFCERGRRCRCRRRRH